MVVNSGIRIACQRKRTSNVSDSPDHRKSNRCAAEPACEMADHTRVFSKTSHPPLETQEQTSGGVEAGSTRVRSSSCVEPVSSGNSLQQSDAKNAHLLMKACEREDAAEERAESAEKQLRCVSDQLRKVEVRAKQAEVSLQEALERVKLLELRVLDRCSSRMSDSLASEVDSDLDSDHDSMEDETNYGANSGSASDDGQPALLSSDTSDPGSAMCQLMLEKESLEARLTLIQQAEADAKISMEASCHRLESFAEMVRGCAAIAFAGSDTSSRRLRHHLFRCLDVDADGFLGVHDLRHWYEESVRFLDTQGCAPVKFEALKHQLADALFAPDLPAVFASKGKVSLMQLSRSKLGASVVCTLLNIHNMMQERVMAEWGAIRHVSFT